MADLKYAFMTFSTPDWTLDEVLSFAAETGYDGIEPRCQAKHRHGVELETSATERADIRRKAEDAGVALCCLATSIRYCDPKQTDAVDTTLRFLDLAAEIGCPSLRVFGGGEGEAVSDYGERHAGRLAELLARVAPEAGARGVNVAVETHDFWMNTDALAVALQQVDHPKIGANWDFSHPFRAFGQSVEYSYQALAGRILHVHFHEGKALPDGKFQFVPIGHPDNEWDHRTALRLLRADGYDGYLSGEWLGQWSDPRNELPRELKAIRAMEAAVSVD